MKYIVVLLYCFTVTHLYSQNDTMIKLVFADKTNFEITTVLGQKRPARYYLIAKTNAWGDKRFKLKENVKDPAVRKKLAEDEHHPYNHSYVFRDSLLDASFGDAEKEFLSSHAGTIQPRKLVKTVNPVFLIPSFTAAPRGFFFSVTDPVFSSDKTFAFIDMVVYHKDKETKELNDTYYATVFLIYQYIKEKGWVRFKKINYLIL